MTDLSSQYCKGMLRVVKESQPVWQMSCSFNCTQTGKNTKHLLQLSEQSKVDNVLNTLRLGVWAASCLKSSAQDSSKNRDKSSIKQPSPVLPSALTQSLAQPFSMLNISVGVLFTQVTQRRYRDRHVAFRLPENSPKSLYRLNLAVSAALVALQ